MLCYNCGAEIDSQGDFDKALCYECIYVKEWVENFKITNITIIEIEDVEEIKQSMYDIVKVNDITYYKLKYI